VRIAIVGPAPPDRGGIAQQTRLLAANLGADLALYASHARPYPRWLDPRRFADAPDLAGFEPASERIFDYARPSSWTRTAEAVRASGAQAVLVPWWTSFWALPVRGLFGRLAEIEPEIRRFLLCHNVVEHETTAWKRVLSRAAFARAHGMIVHSEGDRARLSGELARKTVRLLALPVERRPRPDRSRVRRELGIEGPLVLFLGLVRRYKGVDVLLEAAPQIRAGSGATIAVVGEVFREARAQIRSAPDGVRLVDRYLREEEMDGWLAACDVVVCPYRRISSSAIAARAVGAGRPIVASDLPGFRPFVGSETGELVPPGDAPALARAVLQVIARGVDSYGPALERVARRHDWSAYVAGIRDFCLTTFDNPQSRSSLESSGSRR
jgi:D-inositol-3-phosphate glycosyltransferase